MNLIMINEFPYSCPSSPIMRESRIASSASTKGWQRYFCGCMFFWSNNESEESARASWCCPSSLWVVLLLVQDWRVANPMMQARHSCVSPEPGVNMVGLLIGSVYKILPTPICRWTRLGRLCLSRIDAQPEVLRAFARGWAHGEGGVDTILGWRSSRTLVASLQVFCCQCASWNAAAPPPH